VLRQLTDDWAISTFDILFDALWRLADLTSDVVMTCSIDGSSSVDPSPSPVFS
jgi:hypothetical protein